MRRLDNITNSMDMNLSKLQEIVEDRGAWSVGLERKIAAIQKAIGLHKPDKKDVIDVLAKVGGLDLAALLFCALAETISSPSLGVASCNRWTLFSTLL